VSAPNANGTTLTRRGLLAGAAALAGAALGARPRSPARRSRPACT